MRPHWLIAAAVASALAGSPGSAADFARFGLRWSWVNLGAGYDGQSVGVADFDGDGSAEVLVPGCAGTCWALLTRGSTEYRELATSLPQGLIDLLRLVPLPGGGAAVLASAGDRLTITTPHARRPLSRVLALPTATPRDFALVDRDGDGTLELVVVDDLDLYVLDFSTGALEAVRYGFGGSDLDVGGIDADGAPELAVASGLGSCWILDGATLAVDWETLSGCGRHVALAQLTPDTSLELASDPMPDWSHAVVSAWDPPGTTPMFETAPWPGEPTAFGAADVDGVAGDELLFASGDAPGLRILRGADGELQSVLPEPGVYGFGVGDTDRRPGPELVTIGVFYSGGFDLVSFFDARTLGLEESTPSRWVQARGSASADLDGDGDLELVTGGWSDPQSSLEGPFANAFVFAGLDGLGPTARHLSETRWWNGLISQFRAADLDGDQRGDVCATFSVGYSFAGCFAGLDGTPFWTAQLSPLPSELLLADIDGDGGLELVTEGHWSYDESRLWAFAAADGALRWQSPNLAPDTSDVDRLCSGTFVPGQGARLLAGDADNGHLSFLDPADGAVPAVVASDAHSGLACADLDGDSLVEIVGSDWDGNLGVIKPASGGWAALIARLAQPLRALAVGDLVGDAGLEVAGIDADGLRVVDVATGATVWTQPGTFHADWYSGFLEVRDVDGDGRAELVVGGDFGIAVFGWPYSGSVLLVDGFESGDVRAWSRAAT